MNTAMAFCPAGVRPAGVGICTTRRNTKPSATKKTGLTALSARMSHIGRVSISIATENSEKTSVLG